MNRKVYNVCVGIDDAERRRDRGAFFRSIHGTLNHLLFGDRARMGRLSGRQYAIAPMGVDLYDDFQELRAARAADQDILEWTADLTEAWLREPLTWTSGVDGITRTRPRWLLASHLFNHQTHHRGQLTTRPTCLGWKGFRSERQLYSSSAPRRPERRDSRESPGVRRGGWAGRSVAGGRI